MKKAIPEYVLRNYQVKTYRQWKALKRMQLKLAIRAIDQLMCGCAYTPKGEYIGTIKDDLYKLKVNWSVKEWGR